MNEKKEILEEKKLDLEYYENIILVNCINDEQYLAAIVDHANPAYFVDKQIRLIFNKIVEFFNDRGVCPTYAEIKAKLISDEDKLALRDVLTRNKNILGDKFNKEELYENTEKFLKERGLHKTLEDMAENYTKGKREIGDSLQEFEKIYAISLNEDLGHWYFENIDAHIQDLKAIYNPMPTGWKSLDDKIEGGLFPKTLVCFLGQVNVGKSIVLGNIATNMTLKGRNVLLISCEMSEFMYSKRISAQLSKIPHNELVQYTDKLKEKIINIGDRLDGNKLVIKEYAPKSVTVRHLEAYIKKLKHKGFKPDVVVIDYINLLKPIGKNLNTYSEIKEIAEHLRAMAFKFNIPVVSASQLKRDSFNKDNPGMEGVSESIALAATCDVMCNIWKPKDEVDVSSINMNMIKNRFGRNTGGWRFNIDYQTLSLSETNEDMFVEDEPTEEDDDKDNNDISSLLDKIADSKENK